MNQFFESLYTALCLAIHTSQLFPPLSPGVRLAVLIHQVMKVWATLVVGGRQPFSYCLFCKAYWSSNWLPIELWCMMSSILWLFI